MESPKFIVFNLDQHRAGYYWMQWETNIPGFSAKVVVYWHGTYFSVMGQSEEYTHWHAPAAVFGPLKALCDGLDYMQRDM